MRLIWLNALRRGFFGGSRVWMVVFAAMGTARLFKRLAGSEPDTVYCEELKPGEALLLTHHADLRLGDDLR